MGADCLLRYFLDIGILLLPDPANVSLRERGGGRGCGAERRR